MSPSVLILVKSNWQGFIELALYPSFQSFIYIYIQKGNVGQFCYKLLE